MKKAIVFLCVIILSLSLISCTDNYQLYNQTRKYADKNCKNGSVDVTLSDLTNFEWDEALVFTYSTSHKEIEDAIGVSYDGTLDMTNGIIFVKDKKIVYDEIFLGNVESRPRFFIYINKNKVKKTNLAVYTPNDAFELTKIELGGSEYYALEPKLT